MLHMNVILWNKPTRTNLWCWKKNGSKRFSEVILVIDEIEKQLKGSLEEDEEINEILLDEIEFKEFTDGIKKKLGTALFFTQNQSQIFSPSHLIIAVSTIFTTFLNFQSSSESTSFIQLEVMDNKLGDDSIKVIAGMKKLQALSLCGNEITSIEKLEPLKALELIQLDLEGNEKLTDDADYRTKVFAMFPHLDILDNCDKEGNEILDDEIEEDDYDGDEKSFDEDDEEEEDYEDDDDEDEEEDEDEDDEPKKKKK